MKYLVFSWAPDNIVSYKYSLLEIIPTVMCMYNNNKINNEFTLLL